MTTSVNWREFKMPFGKYKDKTLDEIRHIDVSYLNWGAEELHSASMRAMFRAALDEAERVDPYATARALGKQRHEPEDSFTYMARRVRQ